MDISLTAEEIRLVEYSKEAVIKYNNIRHINGGVDTLYSFLLSDSGKIFDGACYESNIPHASVCGERCAITNMILHESYKAKIKSIVVADPVPEIQKIVLPFAELVGILFGLMRHLKQLLFLFNMSKVKMVGVFQK